MTGICCLCGAHSTGPYCHAHSWAAGAETPDETPVSETAVTDDKNAINDLVERAYAQGLAVNWKDRVHDGITLTELHGYWLQRFEPGDIIRVGGNLNLEAA